MVDAPSEPSVAEPSKNEKDGSIIVYSASPDFDLPLVREMVEFCQLHGVDPLLLDASADPWFAEHLKDPRTKAFFPLLCVRGGLVGGIEVVRQLALNQQLKSLLAPVESTAVPSIALSESAATQLRPALVEPDQRIRLSVSPDYEHDLALDNPRPGDLELMLGDVPFLLDPDSARRANGIAIDWVEQGDTRAFRIDNPNRPEGVRSVDRAWLEAEGAKLDLLVIDARTASEYAQAHLNGARLLDATLIDALERLPRGQALLFYCNGGVRSRKAAEHYREVGFTQVYCLTQAPR